MEVGIVGVSGYGGGELARLILTHPLVNLAYAGSTHASGEKLADVIPTLRGFTDRRCDAPDLATALSRCDLIFAAQESGWASENAASIIAAGKTLIDLSADLRLRDPDAYRQWYKHEPADASVQAKAAYGLPELFRDKLVGARLIANPGCYATASILALAPAIESGLIDEDNITVSGISGVSGAGRSKHSLEYHFPELNESASAYAVAGAHRHTPEIEQALGDVAGRPVRLSFTPHLIPITRGILATAVAPLRSSFENLRHAYEERYAGEPFVHVLEAGGLPATKHTYGNNNVLIGLAHDKRLGRVTIVAAEDNLVKGAAGQAVQNMNVACGFPETAGLTSPGIWP